MYEKHDKDRSRYIKFIVLDLFSVEIALILSVLINYNIAHLIDGLYYLKISFVLIIIDFAVIIFLNIFNNVMQRGYYREFVTTLWQAIVVQLFLVFYLFISEVYTESSRKEILIFGIIYFVLNYTIRVIAKEYIDYRIIRKVPSILIISNKERIDKCIKLLITGIGSSFKLEGIILTDLENRKVNRTIQNIPVVAHKNDLIDYIKKGYIDEVLLDLPEDYKDIQEFIDILSTMGIPFHINLKRNYDIPYNQQFIEKIGELDVITTTMNSITSRQAFIKRTIDIIGGIVGVVLTSLLYIFIAPLIYIKSPGPILFSQTRIGKNGKRFKLYKFRSMDLDAEKRKVELVAQNRIDNGMMFKVDFDTRIIGNVFLKNGKKKTGVGHFIRKTSIDEFPQFFNVLKGDMSLVGTRPPTLDEWEKYDLHHSARLAIKPGITGMWQVSGRSNITDFEEVVELDKTYIENWDIGLDLRIILKTFYAVFKRDGAM